MNKGTETVAVATESLATARNGVGVGPSTLEEVSGLHGPENRIDGDRHHEAKASRMGRMQTAYFVEADVDPAKLDFVTVNGMRFVPIGDRGHADTEGEAMASFEHLNCPACGGSGHIEDVAGFERFDITKRKSLDGDAALAMDVLRRFAQPGGPLTHGDAMRVVDTIGRLRAAFRHEREHAGKNEARVRGVTHELEGMRATGHVLEDNVEELAGKLASVERQLADMTTNRDALDEACLHKDERIAELSREVAVEIAKVAGLWDRVEGLEAERDAAAENARRERDRRGTYSDEMLRAGAGALYITACQLGVGNLTHAGPNEVNVRKAFVEAILRAAGLVTVREEKPLVRVVASPRFYSEEEREAAITAASHIPSGSGGLVRSFFGRILVGKIVDAVAEALGMRRA